MLWRGDVRALIFSLLVLGCDRPAWHLRSPDGIPRDAPIAIAPATGSDALAVEALDERIVGLVVHDGAAVRQDAAWLVSVQIDSVERCRGGFLPNNVASGHALITIRKDTTITDVVEITASERCRFVGTEASARAVGAALARRVADIIAWRRHAW